MRIRRRLDPAAKRELERDRARRLQEWQRKQIRRKNEKKRKAKDG